MHNVRVTRLPRLISLLTAGVLVSATLAGCGGDDKEKPKGNESSSSTPSSSATEEVEPYLEVPDDVELTAPGSDLSVGDIGVVAWKPKQSLIGVMGILIERIEKTSFKESFQGWDVSKTPNTTPYFVHLKVGSNTPSDLGGVTIPLYALDSGNTLNEASTFTEKFTPCPSGPLPKKFTRGQIRELCLVYLLPSKLTLQGVSFRFNEELKLDPITWTGPIEKVKKDKPKKDKGKKKKKKKPQE